MRPPGPIPLPGIRLQGQPRLRLVLTLLGLILFAVAVWIGLPMTGWAMGATRWCRASVIGGVGFLSFLVWFLRRRRRIRAAREIEAALVPEIPTGDGKELAERMERALATLKKSGGASYLYDLPWYVIIGPPGAGKTTALANSGIEFPLSQAEAISGFGGTRYADFWFAEDAVLIDTAGRYTTQDSDAGADRASWEAFLELLKKSRPNRPINGVILSFSVEDMMTEEPATLARHAEAVRARLAEVHEMLKADFPVYVMFTKADLIAGFREYFASFSLNRRKLVWGATFQTEDRRAITIEAVPGEFDKLVARLSDEVIDRLGEEPDGISRIAMFGLPGQMALLRDNVTDFLRRVFEPTRYKSNAILRGFYFTSGTQEGTPIDQVLGAMTRSGGGVSFQPAFMSGKGKSYFIHDLLRRVIFAEQGWVSLDGKALRRAMILRGLAFGGIAAITLAALAGFGISYWANDRLVGTAAAETATYAAAVSQELQRQVISDPDLTPILPLLDDLSAIPARLGQSGPWERLGLSQRARVLSAARDAYSDALERMMRPRMILDLEQQLPQIIRDGETTAIYRALKVYLLLGGQGEKTDDEAIRAWFDARWHQLYADRAGIDMRARLGGHLAAMLAMDSDRNLLVDVDQATVDAARQAIAQLPVDEQAYAMLQDGVAASGLPDWSLIEATDPDGAMVFATRDGTDLASMTVPAIYRHDSFWSHVYPGLEEVGQKLRDDQWVLGDPAEHAEIEDRLNRLDRDVMTRYRRDFKSAWDHVLNNLALTNLAADKPRYQVLEAAASASASPVLALVKAVDAETFLPREDEEPAGLAAGGPGSGPRDSAMRPITLIAEDFANWHDLLRGEVGKRPIDRLLGNLGAIRQNLRLAEQSPDQSAATLPSLLNSLTRNNSQLPPQLAGLVTEAEADFRQDDSDVSLERMNRALADDITVLCRETIASAYPFGPSAHGPSAHGLSIDSFARFFGPGGDMDRYFAEYLAPYVERSPDGLRYRQDKPLAGRMSTATLLQFQRAEVIRQTFFADGRPQPSVEITVTQVDAHPTVESALLSINDAIVLTVTGSRPQTITWPGTGGSTVLQLSPALNLPSQLRFEGSAWTFLELLDAASSARQQGDRLRTIFVVGGRSITYDFTINTVKNPFTMAELRQFECPQGLE